MRTGKNYKLEMKEREKVFSYRSRRRNTSALHCATGIFATRNSELELEMQLQSQLES